MKTPTFYTLIQGFLQVVWKKFNKVLVVDLSSQWPMRKLYDEGKQIKKFPFVIYVGDATFQQCNRDKSFNAEKKGVFWKA